jgi:hypothetical protein
VPELLHHLAQAWVLCTSCLAVYFVARTEPNLNRWGYVFGLASEPGWMYASWVADQWGTFLLTIWWSYYWGVGAWRRFKKDEA